MAETKKTITPDQRLKAFALFSMAVDHYAKMREFETAIGELLGYDEDDSGYLGCLSDEIYDGGNFSRGLKKEGFVVKAPAKKTARKR
jgi:hypothetical protein